MESSLLRCWVGGVGFVGIVLKAEEGSALVDVVCAVGLRSLLDVAVCFNRVYDCKAFVPEALGEEDEVG